MDRSRPEVHGLDESGCEMCWFKRLAGHAVMLLACALCYAVGYLQFKAEFPPFIAIPLIPMLLIAIVSQVGFAIVLDLAQGRKPAVSEQSSVKT